MAKKMSFDAQIWRGILDRWKTETTNQGEQIIIPGAERSAHQAAAARGEKIRSKAMQRDPGGMFEPVIPQQPKLF